MNYNNKFPTFSFRIERYQDQKITKLASQEKNHEQSLQKILSQNISKES